MSLFQELRRRNVFRVGIAYAVGAWLVLQLTEVLSELLNLPEEIGPVVVAAVVIGFPVVLFAAWAYELTPQGIKRESEVRDEASITRSTGRKLNALIIGMMAVAIAYLLFDKFLLRDAAPERAVTAEPANDLSPLASNEKNGDGATVPREAPAEAAIPAQSVAVLPFTNRSPVADDEFFIDGIHDDLLTNLARISGLKVISRTSVARFRDTEVPIPDIARELGVATVMEGAVQRAGDMVRINVQLIDAQTDEHLWAQIYDRPLTTENLFAIQSEISGAIAAALQATLTPEEAERLNDRPTDSLEAYSAYLRGQRDFGRREVATLQRALEEFQRAVELDPEFALAWAGIAQVSVVQPSWGLLPMAEALQVAAPAAARAMELAPHLGEARLAQAMVTSSRGEEAEDLYREAIALLPNHAPAHHWYGNLLEDDLERTEEALALFRKAVSLDPLSPLYRHQVGRFLIMRGRFEEADRELALITQSDPDFFPGLSWRGIAQGAMGNFDQAVVWTRQSRLADPDSFFGDANLLFNLVDLQDHQRLEALRESLRRDNPESPILPYVEASMAGMDGRLAAALEIVGAIDPSRAFIPPQFFALRIHAWLGDWETVRAIEEQMNPEFFDRVQQPAAVAAGGGNACIIGYALIRTGDPELGKALIDEAIRHATVVLPQHVRHAANLMSLHHCYAALGDTESALSMLATLVDHRHYQTWWELPRLEYFQPLVGDPRFESLLGEIDAEMARQRANLDRIDQDEVTGP